MRTTHDHTCTTRKHTRRLNKKCFPSRARDDERPLWDLRHRRPRRAPMAWLNRRCAHCHLPPRALPDAQPQQHGAQCAGIPNGHNLAQQAYISTKQHSCAPRGPGRSASAARPVHTFFAIANRLARPHMLFFFLHSPPTSLCSLLHSTLQATCTGALAASRRVNLEAQ